MTDHTNPADGDEHEIANWTALRLRSMYEPTVKGLFMAGGKTPHQYLTAEIKQLLAQQATKLLERVEDKLLDNSIGLANEDTAVLWDEVHSQISLFKQEYGRSDNG